MHGKRWRLLALAAVTLTLSGAGVWLGASAQAAAVGITPGLAWTDSSGNPLEAHGAGIFKSGSTYYLVGEDKTAGGTFTAVACYSSSDLLHWTRQADALRQGSGDLAAGRIIERPKVIFNSSTGKYVMWMHVDSSSYGDARAGVATSSTPCGPYTYLGSARPLGFISRDLGLFKDDDGTAYLLTEDRDNGLRIDKLSADYTTVASATKVLTDLEAPAMVKVNGRYFLFASHLSGWAPNDNVYATATSLSGTWSSFTTFAPSGTNTYSTQTSYVLPVTGTSTTSYVYIGDRWNSATLNGSLPVWLPLTISGSSASMSFYGNWTVDTATGSVATQSVPSPARVIGWQSGRCLDVTNSSQSNGTAVETYACNGGANQQWTLTSAGELRVYSGKCLEAYAQGQSAGTLADIWDCNGGANQKWTLTQNGTIVGQQSGLCLDVASQNVANAGKVELYTCNGGWNQRWTRG